MYILYIIIIIILYLISYIVYLISYYYYYLIYYYYYYIISYICILSCILYLIILYVIGNGKSVLIWHGWSIACRPLMACCDFFLDKLSNSAPFCSHFPIGPKYFCTLSQKVSNSTDLNWCNHVLRVACYSNQNQAKHF